MKVAMVHMGYMDNAYFIIDILQRFTRYTYLMFYNDLKKKKSTTIHKVHLFMCTFYNDSRGTRR